MYEWFVKETGEIFYVGKGRDDRYKEFHARAYEAEKIRKLYETDVRFVATNLTEEEALQQETDEMKRILNETNDCLTNRITPFGVKRGSGYDRSKSTPPFQFETAPIFYASEIEEHYFNIHGKAFDKVDPEQLTVSYIIDKTIAKDEIRIVYGDDYSKYYMETIKLLEKHGAKVTKSRYAKKITAWIYPCDDYVTNRIIDEKNAEERVGRYIPAYHLIDVWKCLKSMYGDVSLPEEEAIIAPIHSRVSLDTLPRVDFLDEANDDIYDQFYEMIENAEAERKLGNLQRAIEILDKARSTGCYGSGLYQSYALVYRKMNDLDNEIDVLNEAIHRCQLENYDTTRERLSYEDQKRKAVKKLIKSKEKK